MASSHVRVFLAVALMKPLAMALPTLPEAALVDSDGAISAKLMRSQGDAKTFSVKKMSGYCGTKNCAKDDLLSAGWCNRNKKDCESEFCKGKWCTGKPKGGGSPVHHGLKPNGALTDPRVQYAPQPPLRAPSQSGGKKRTGGKLKGWQKTVLKLHNQFRCMHGVPKVKWDHNVAKAAQEYIRHKSSMQHSDSYNLPNPYGPAGENLAMRIPTMQVASSVTSWYQEVRFCQGGKRGFRDGCQRGKNGNPTGHFTAMVWKGVKKIGCAKNKLNTILICRYWSGPQISNKIANMGPNANYKANVKHEKKSKQACKKKR